MQVDSSHLLAQSKLTATQFKVLHAVWFLDNPTLQGVKYLTDLQLTRVAEAAEMLARKRLVMVGPKGITPIDASNWCERCLKSPTPCKMHKLLRSSYINNLTTIRKYSLNKLHGHDFGDTPITYSIVALVEKRFGFKYTPSKWRAETGNAVKLYRLALSLTRNELKAVQAIVDQLEHMVVSDKGFTTHVRFPVAVLYSNFAQWYASIPPKPRTVLEDEELMGKRHRYNLKTKRWEPIKNATKSNTP